MQIKDYDIVGSYNNQSVSSLDAERSVNVFEYRDVRGKKPKCLINTSGLTNTNTNFLNATLGFRAQFVFQGFEYDVIGNSVYRRSTNGVVSFLGNLANTETGYVGIDANTFQVIIVDGVNGYIFDTMASTFEMISDSSFPTNPIDVCYLDGFFVVANGNTNNFQLSMFNQGMVWGPASNVFTVTGSTLQIGNSSIGGPSNTANYATGVPVTLSTSGTLPNPLNNSSTYYSILVDDDNIMLATSYANAIAGMNIVLTNAGTGPFAITSLGQLQLGSITSHTGNIVACRTLHRRLFLFSTSFTEVWENAGIGTNLPFRRNNSLLIEYGTPCIGSIAASFDTMLFISQAKDSLGPVMQVNGSQAIPVSTHALDTQLSTYAATMVPNTNPPQSQITDCRAFMIKENGLIFYRMNFTAANHTFIYDVSLSNPATDEGKLWHEEEVLNGNRHPAQTHAYFNGVNYVGDYLSPTLYQVNRNEYTNNGEPIRRMRIPRPFVPEAYQRVRCDRFQLDLLQGQLNEIEFTTLDLNLLTEPTMAADLEIFTENELELDTETGFPLIDETFTPIPGPSLNIDTENGLDLIAEESQVIYQNATPFVFLSLSKDGSQTYGYKVRSPMGLVGNRTFRTVWRKLGTTKRGQSFQPKVEFFSTTPFIILGAAWAFEVLPE